MKVLVCGSRDWNNRLLIWNILMKYPKDTEIITGGAAGADEIAADVAKRLFLKVTVIPANWSVYGRAAGPLRNREMLDMRPDLVIAFHNDIEWSKGTKDCVKEAERRGIPVDIISEVKE